MSILIKSYGDLSWLPNSTLCGIDMPRIIYLKPEETDLMCSGFYDPSEKTIAVIQGEEHEEETASILAHEFMHHLQNVRGTTDESPPRFNREIPYEEAIAEFYKSSREEYEALLFECKFAKGWLNDWQLRKLVWES